MPPGPLTELRTNSPRLQALHGGLLAGLVALIAPLPAWAQDGEAAPGLVGADDFRENEERERERREQELPPPPSPQAGSEAGNPAAA